MSRNRSNNNDERRRRKKIHDSEYIAYCEHGDSAAVFIMRDIQNKVNVGNMWIDILSTKKRSSHINNKYWHDFEWFVVELFPKKLFPDYSPAMSDDDKRYETWKTAKIDVSQQRRSGFKGRKYIVYPHISITYAPEPSKTSKVTTTEMFDPVRKKWTVCNSEQIPEGVTYRIKEITTETFSFKEEKREYEVRKIQRIR